MVPVRLTNEAMANRQRYFNNLTKADYDVIDQKQMLNDKHIYQFKKLLSKDSNGLFNMRDTLFLQMPQYIEPVNEGEKHIQILFSGGTESGHWICTYYDGVRIYVFDSVNRRDLDEQQRFFLHRLYPFNPPIVFTIVDQQPMGTVDCGVYAIAFATSLLFNVMPNTIHYDNENGKMREHLKKMFEDDRLRPFQVVRAINNRPIMECDNNLQRVSSIKDSEIKCLLDNENERKRIRAMKDKERSRKAKLTETYEQKIIRLENERLKKRNSRENETQLQRKKRQQKDLTCKRKKLSLETEDMKRERQQKSLASVNKKISSENDDEKKMRQQKNLACKKNKLLTETEDEKKLRQQKDVKCKKNKLSTETADERKLRQQKDLTAKKRKLSLETEVETKERQQKNLECKHTKLSLETEIEELERQVKDLERKRDKKK